MPVSNTLLDIARANAADQTIAVIDETTKGVPELTKAQSRVIRGINYKTLVRVGLPTVAFRGAGGGSAVVRGEYVNRLVDTFILNPIWQCDMAIADAHEDGAAKWIAIEGMGIITAAMQRLGSCFYYGRAPTFGDAAAFPGLLECYDQANMTIDAGGTTAATGSSVWAVRFGEGEVQWVWGQNGELKMGDAKEVVIKDDNGLPLSVYHQELMARPGLQVGNLKRVGRIANLTADAGKGLTDKLLGQLYALFPVGFPPDAYFVNRRSLEQLRASRTATNPTGAEAPYPTDALGVPIYATDGIGNTEPLTFAGFNLPGL